MDVVYNAEPTLAQFHASDAFIRGVKGPVGCTSADTEFLTPGGWKRIDQYADGDLVAQWDNGTMEFVSPSRYVKEPADELIQFKNINSVSMILSPEHRMPLYNYAGEFVVKQAHQIEAHPSKYLVPTTFYNGSKGLGLTPSEIRLRVMIAADAHYNKRGTLCTVCLRKQRKIDRLLWLLSECGIQYKEYNCARPTERVFAFTKPSFEKPLHLSANWYMASSEELAVLLDEVSFWDGLYNHEESRFSSNKIEEVEVVQFAAHACGRVAHIRHYTSNNPNCNPTHTCQWSREGSPKLQTGIRSDTTSISRVPAEGGFKYCFTVPSSFWIARHNGIIFVTGNSGKSVGMCAEILSRACQQKVQTDGVRRSRWGVIRNTYIELKTTTIRTWRDWVPEACNKMKWDAPISSVVKIQLPDETSVELEVLFVSLDRPADIRKLKSMELTGIWINEACEEPKAILDMATARVGRYPAKKDGGSAWSGVIMDTNAMDTDHWWYYLAEKDLTSARGAKAWKEIQAAEAMMRNEGLLGENQPLMQFFSQPPALIYRNEHWEPNRTDAENIQNLDGGFAYYLRQVVGKSYEWINTFLAGNYGKVVDGKVVFPEYCAHLHAPGIMVEPQPGLPILIGLDFGLTPAALIGQCTSRGQLLILGEVCSEDMGIRQFLEDALKPYLANNFGNEFEYKLYGDPAGNQKAQTDKRTCFEEVRLAGFTIEPARTNAFIGRREAVAGFLTKLVDGEPGMLIDMSCQMFIKGLAGGYHFKRVQILGEERYKDEPDKNVYSHICDAGQYLALSVGSVQAVAARKDHRPKWAKDLRQNVKLGGFMGR